MAGGHPRRRRATLLWMVVVAGLIITLLLLEQVALLYVLATLGMSALLIIVALADLGLSRQFTQPPPSDDGAAIGDRATAAALAGDSPTGAVATGAPRPARRPSKRR